MGFIRNYCLSTKLEVKIENINYCKLVSQCLLINLIFHPIFTDVIVNDPATALSLNNFTSSFSSFNDNTYNKGR